MTGNERNGADRIGKAAHQMRMLPAAGVYALMPDLLRARREVLLNDWHNRILNAHEPETATLLRNVPDRFANPVAHAFREAIEAIYRILIGEDDVNVGPVDYAVKIRAVQERDPEKAIQFIAPIRDIVRERFGGRVPDEELRALESRMDWIMVMASEMFAAHRERIASLGRSARAAGYRQ